MIGHSPQRVGNRAAGVVYMDHCATGPVDPRTVEAMLPYFTERFGAAECAQHAHGAEAARAVARARAQVADLVGAEPGQVVFTSGATEADLLAIRGVLGWARSTGRTRFVTLATEHAAVLETIQSLRAEGFEPVTLPVEADGSVDPMRLASAIDSRTALVSVMAVNHETGTVQPLAEIAALCRRAGALFHCDAAQAPMRMRLSMAATGIHLLSLSGHKMAAPKGVGALVVAVPPEVRLQSVFPGGDQERTLRPGTLPVPFCVAMGTAAAILRQDLAEDLVHLSALTRRLAQGIRALIPAARFAGAAEMRAPGVLAVTFPQVAADLLMAAMPGIAVSSPRDTATVRLGRGHVLHAMGFAAAEIDSTLRFSLGRTSTAEDVEAALEQLGRALALAQPLPAHYRAAMA